MYKGRLPPNQTEESEDDHDYAETDPTGRYGRVSFGLFSPFFFFTCMHVSHFRSWFLIAMVFSLFSCFLSIKNYVKVASLISSFF